MENERIKLSVKYSVFMLFFFALIVLLLGLNISFGYIYWIGFCVLIITSVFLVKPMEKLLKIVLGIKKTRDSFWKQLFLFLPVVIVTVWSFYFLLGGDKITSVLLLLSGLSSMMLVMGYDYLLQKEGEPSLFAKREKVDVTAEDVVAKT